MNLTSLVTIKKLATALCTLAAVSSLTLSANVYAAEKLEKESLKLGFIKLTDMAPLAVALEKGYFEDEGLSVQLEAQANWKVLLDRVISGELDGAHMLATLPFGTAIGYGTKADIVSAFTMTLNGDAITVSNDVWKQMKPQIPVKDGKLVHPVKADTLKPVLEKYKAAGKPFNMAMTFPVGTHNMKLRYWLAAGGIKPGFYAPPEDTSGQIDAEAMLSVTPPPQMPATMDSGTIVGYCVGEPWNQQAVFKGIGVPVISDYELMKNSAEKIFGVTKEFADKNPNTHKAIVKALIRASMWLDAENNKNRNEGVEMLSQKQYVGADYEILANSMNGTFEYEKGDKRPLADFNVFFRHNGSYPYYSDAIWSLTQMRRWGQINEYKPDAWYLETAKKVYRPDVFMAAAKALIADGKAKASDFPADSETGIKPASAEFIDGVSFDANKPNDYLAKFAIGLKGKQKVVGGKVVE
ncbi:MAG: CmpA/NrtA family ABC transporter substrate-binding protein [Methylococcaceae bacterium]|nr:CmpA/NrtA family ABC transporter substrate-binding protein [Methylococcaceae bacterium]MDZ4155046.1 CmpA/NrtA family ABC transporter substrate-binding protein [Methylococcales bacterium]MDP2394509.1 CmpA/NrtA family ABC transporter substrate-binding protein [Methylococcaceae bacterium]MDP3021552.1 CmpA/NrtA family ABC transporter substrate-binding protein [Methylococcaceae bacterium]MDP3388678.1 CmpA/NrtA family ABC transporter substrate-binding protein [Methylococcaceae bacterium]